MPDPGVPKPALFQPENRPARLLYYPGPLAPTDKRFALVRFPACWIIKFGYPGDEALEGHPLYDKGLRQYGIFEVLESSWERQLAEQNRVAFPEYVPTPSRHFVVTFHDSTFECLADAIEGLFTNDAHDLMRDEGLTFDSGSE